MHREIVHTETEQRAAFLLAPQTPEELGWTGDAVRNMTFGILDHIMANYAVDPRRVYLTGFSMGGTGSFVLPAYRPDQS